MTKDHVLIVEDSLAITMLLKNYLEKIGYVSIHACDSGTSAIQTFKELSEQDKIPIVLLDYQLPDMDARSIFTQILQIQPNARVILETATEKEDEGIRELIRIGLYQYIEKPIRFEALKAIFETLETEKGAVAAHRHGAQSCTVAMLAVNVSNVQFCRVYAKLNVAWVPEGPPLRRATTC